MKTGLVMEGGAMRGMFTAGVTDVLMENNIEFEGAAGTSAGAGFGCNFKSRQPGRVLKYTLRFCKDRRFAGLQSLLTTGDIYGVEMCYYAIPYEYAPFDFEAFAENPMEFYSVATDLLTGQAVYHKFTTGEGVDLRWLRASASMPVVSRPVKIGRRLLLDGGMSDSIPLKFMEHRGYKRNLVILTRSEQYRKDPFNGMALVKAMYHKYPRFIKAMEQRYIGYNETLRYIREQEEAGNCFVIRPNRELDIPPICHDKSEIKRVYRIGRAEARRRLKALKEWMEEA